MSERDAGRRRAAGDTGSGAVAAITLIFAFTFLGLVWLARDVDRSISNRSAAQSIAFQAARAGAQQVEVGALRGSGGDAIAINETDARAEVDRIASDLFASYGVVGRHTVTVTGDSVTVTVTIEDPVDDVTATGTVQAQTGP